MKSRHFFMFSTFALALLVTVPGFAASKEKKASTRDRGVRVTQKKMENGGRRIALVIGNGDYKVSPLRNPVNDARLMASTLKAIGFELYGGKPHENLSAEKMKLIIDNFGRSLKSGGVGLFYYAGHGMQVNGNNYLIPVDAEIEGEEEVDYKAVNAGLVTSKMALARNELNIIILDACRNNPFSRSFRSTNQGLASMIAPAGTIVAYATNPGGVAADGSSGNGLYTNQLARAMTLPGLKIEDVFKRVRGAVQVASSGRQIPWESTSLVGEFYFIPPSSRADPRSAPAEPSPEPAAPATGSSAGTEFTDPATGMKFVPVRGGCFRMGDNFGDGNADESPSHRVCVSDFSIGKYEVTQGEWQAVMGDSSSMLKGLLEHLDAGMQTAKPASFKNCGAECPVENVSWSDAQDFIERLNARSGRNYRLPTEAEWEYAARSGGRMENFSGGGDIDAVAWHDGNSGGKPHPVGRKRPNGLGIYDMSGNVLEWVQDWYDSDYYAMSPKNDPKGPSSGTDRVSRGGSWNNEAGFARASCRSGFDPAYRFFNLGFRLAAPAR